MKNTNYFFQVSLMFIALLTASVSKGQIVYTSTGSGQWTTSGTWTSTGSSGTVTYIIQSGHTVNISTSISGIDSILVYGNLTVSSNPNINIDLSSSGLVYLSSSTSLTGGQGSTRIRFGGSGVIQASGGYNFLGESYANAGTGGTFVIGNPLPVSWVNVAAQIENGAAVISWQTASELNNSHFEVEKAGVDGDFAVIGVVQGAGNSNALLSYRFQDVQFDGSTSFYRIRQVDFDGAYEYSAVMRLSAKGMNSDVTKVQMFPTLFTNASPVFQASLSNLPEGLIEVMVSDLNGRIMTQYSTFNAADGSSVVLPLSGNFTPGYYLVNVTVDGVAKQPVRILMAW